MTKKEFIEEISNIIEEYTDDRNDAEYEDIDEAYSTIGTDEFLIEYSIYRQNR